ncbi:IS200/IS605 family accessory protein TnpB-related protein [Nocardiopsis dassonvillei]|uniref:IS200/IS605 family accessory protein TnpB-related protein n=1 Tax=Nocardiopsis dassonvillei TaxID=2014 RepID=UPI003700A295
MAGTGARRLRSIADPFLAPAPTGVSVRDRLKGLTPRDETVLRAVGAHLGSLASTDLAARCAHGSGHDKDAWAARKRELTPESSSRWAGALTKASNEQWALARRSQLAHLHRLQTGIDTLRHRLSQPLKTPGTRGAPGGYASRQEWHAKSRRLAALEHRHAVAVAAWQIDTHGNPTGNPRRFAFELSGSASQRDAQVRHALSRLLRWATAHGVRAIAVEDLDFAREKTREKHGRRKKFRRLISGFPTARLRSRLVSMAHTLGVSVIAVDPAYTSKWGAQHWQRP